MVLPCPGPLALKTNPVLGDSISFPFFLTHILCGRAQTPSALFWTENRERQCMALKLHSIEHLMRGILCTLSLLLSLGSTLRDRQDMHHCQTSFVAGLADPQSRRDLAQVCFAKAQASEPGVPGDSWCPCLLSPHQGVPLLSHLSTRLSPIFASSLLVPSAHGAGFGLGGDLQGRRPHPDAGGILSC